MGVNGNEGDRMQSDGKGRLQWGPSARIRVGTALSPRTRTAEWKDLPDKLHSMTMILDGLVTKGDFKILLGSSDGIITTGYRNMGGFSPARTDAFSIRGHATRGLRGFIDFKNGGFNQWNMSYHIVELHSGTADFHRGGGYLNLSQRLNRVRLLTTQNITAGKVNLQWQAGK